MTQVNVKIKKHHEPLDEIKKKINDRGYLDKAILMIADGLTNQLLHKYEEP